MQDIHIYTAEYFDSFDENSPILGLSVGTPIGIKAGLAYLTLKNLLIISLHVLMKLKVRKIYMKVSLLI